jgi:hypothetical protein
MQLFLFADDLQAFKHFTDHKTGFVTRIKDNAIYEEIEVLKIPEATHSGVLSDKIVEVEIKKTKKKQNLS